MEKEVVAAFLGALGGLASGVVTAWVTLKAKGIDRLVAMETKRIDKVVEELKLWVSAYETKMLEQRLTDYRKLWRLTESTSRRKISTLTSQSAHALAEQLTDWYYREGGIVLSEDARDKFFEARNSLEPVKRAQNTKQWHARGAALRFIAQRPLDRKVRHGCSPSCIQPFQDSRARRIRR